MPPALARLEGLPLVYLNAVGRTCLRDDSVLLARWMFAAGVAHEFSVVERVTHGFMHMGSELSQAAAALREAAHFVATILRPEHFVALLTHCGDGACGRTPAQRIPVRRATIQPRCAVAQPGARGN